jgi:F-type H+-transporting ATPase subunit gamma
MYSVIEIKRRIGTIRQTRQITKAMHLIASSKLSRAMERYKANHIYFEKIRSTLKDIIIHTPEINHPFFMPRGSERAAYFVVAGDKGLCGAYNHNVLHTALSHVQQHEGSTNIFVVGHVARDFFSRKGYSVDAEFLYAAHNPTFYYSREIAEQLIEAYSQYKMDELYLIYTHMESTVKQTPKVIKLLPVELSAFRDVNLDLEYRADILYQPSHKAVLDLLIPKYILGVIYGALIQSFASEQQARMLAMDTATKNADDMIADLQIKYNQARQAVITNEIAEIMGGVVALK